jgi:integrase
VLEDAIRDKVIPGPNPIQGLRPPRGAGRRGRPVLSEQQLHDLANAALEVHASYGPTVRAMILVAGYTGMREGEMYALRWTDVDTDQAGILRTDQARAKLSCRRRARVGGS